MAARRVLVPLVVLAFAVFLWFWRGCSHDVRPPLPADIDRCAENLRAIYAGLITYRERTGHAPEESGVAFLGALIASGVWEDTPENRARLTCPGPGAAAVREDVDYKTLAGLTGADSAYAARDTKAFPLAKFPSGGVELEPLVACDNARGPNHAGSMNVLYSDGSVVVLVFAQEIERGTLPAGAHTIAVGKDSPVEDLRKLAGD